eukprot:6616554-Alexandrium_andersonii.AAC.1
MHRKARNPPTSASCWRAALDQPSHARGGNIGAAALPAVSHACPGGCRPRTLLLLGGAAAPTPPP